MFKTRQKGHAGPSKGKKPQAASRAELEAFLQTEPLEKDGVIYIHVPFCDNICSFCSMNRTKLNDELDDYTKFLLGEIEKYGKFPYLQGKNFRSVYFGGGTPTILKEKHLKPVITALRANFNISDDCEFSLESTLHNLNLGKLRLLESLGVNRFSIGVQTFSDKGRKLLNRVGGKNAAIKRLKALRQNFDGMLCTDIIFNYPNQSLNEVLQDARLIDELSIDSTSFYSLQFFEGSTLGKTISQDYYDVNYERELHNAFARELFSTGNYEVLEYTKFNRKGRDEYRYIRLGHQGADVLPLGKGAGGHIGNYGLYNVKENMQMISKSDDKQRAQGRFKSLFQYDKIDLARVKNFIGDESFGELMEFFKKCEEAGYLKIENGFLNYTIDGVFWGNSIATEVSNITQKDFE